MYIIHIYAYIVSYDSHNNLQKKVLLFCFSHHMETQRNKMAYPKWQNWTGSRTLGYGIISMHLFST